MRFGVREICNVVLRAKATQTLGSRKFYKNEPVLYFDTLKTSSLEGASTTVYATGGRGNTRLVAWEGERTLTFTMEDALISPEGFAILSGAGLIAATEKAPIYVHTTSQVQVEEMDTIVLPNLACWSKYTSTEYKDYKKSGADIFIMVMKDGEICAEPCIPAEEPKLNFADGTTTIKCYSHAGHIEPEDVVLVDYYVKRIGGAQTIEITADKFGGNYYLEASTLFRRESDGVDMPAEFIIPNCKVQSNFTFSMASSGDPSTFTFTMDAFPDYTKFDLTHKVLAAIQVIEDENEEDFEERQPCAAPEVGIKPYGNSDVIVTYDNDSTENDIKVTISGSSIIGNAANGETQYRTSLFNANGELDNVNAIGMALDFRGVVDAEKKYRITQSNPALTYYKNDEHIVGGLKDNTYNGSDLATDADGYEFIVSEKPGQIVVKLYELQDDEDEVGSLIRSVKITKDITFKAIPKKDN